MTDNQKKIIIGGLLRDIGKVLSQDGAKNYNERGYIFLKNEAKLKDEDILQQVRYYHSQDGEQKKLEDQSSAYITYMANNIASGIDRRDEEDEAEFVKNRALESIFNVLNHNKGKSHYNPLIVGERDEINFPTEDEITYTPSFYQKVEQKIKKCLAQFSYEDTYLNYLLETLEETLSFVPSSVANRQLVDISLYDHMKMTAAIGSCIYEYLEENQEVNYKNILIDHKEEFYEKKIFLVYSMDISGIQDFIYTINSKGALKGLRARSFYLEIMMEHLIDDLLAKIGLSRVNLIYSGGGHAYLLVANTDKTKRILEKYEQELNQWFLKVFQTALYVGCGYAQCSVKDLRNKPAGSYTEIFRIISKNISQKKIKRYEAKDILWLNHRHQPDEKRECSVCRRSDHLRGDNKCKICWSLEQMASRMMDYHFFIVNRKEEEISLPLPGDYYLLIEKEEENLKNCKKKDDYVRAYSKNQFYSGYSVSTKLWVGDYCNGNDFQDLASEAQGIKRIGVLRADIDNLGQTFVKGFQNEENQDRYVTISRTATFSRKLSLFFKYHVNDILKHGTFYLQEKEKKERNAVVVYSGGDDLFIVGSWDDIIGFAVDLYYALKKYTQGMLTISGGIGIYSSKYPIAAMARQTGKLEDAAKELEGKNAITLFDSRYTFHWENFIEVIIGQKFQLLKIYLEQFQKERGKAFLHRILELIRAIWTREEGKINIARFAYQLARIEPDKNASEEHKNIYQKFSKSMYQWMKNEEDARQLELAIYLYVYLLREEE